MLLYFILHLIASAFTYIYVKRKILKEDKASGWTNLDRLLNLLLALFVSWIWLIIFIVAARRVHLLEKPAKW